MSTYKVVIEFEVVENKLEINEEEYEQELEGYFQSPTFQKVKCTIVDKNKFPMPRSN